MTSHQCVFRLNYYCKSCQCSTCFHVLTFPYCNVTFLFFFFQAEDGIRDHCVTGVQTCALPISYPVEPWKLIMMTTYPLAAKSSGFQRKLQSSPQAPWGPPWMRNFTGYFLVASKFGGLTRKPSTLSPFAPVKKKDSIFDMLICDSKLSFTRVIAQSLFKVQSSFPGSTSPVLAGQPSPPASLA